MVRWFGFGVAAAVLALSAVGIRQTLAGRRRTGARGAGRDQLGRAHPADYADRLRDAPPTRATDEAIDYLLRRPRPVPRSGTRASRRRPAGMRPTRAQHGAFTHTGSDGSSAGERMHRAGVWAGMMAEEMSAGEGSRG